MKALILLMAVVCVGCASGPKEESQTSPTPSVIAEPTAPKTASWVSDPNDPNNVKIEKAIRKAAKKPTGELTKADLEKITVLSLGGNNLTKAPKDLEKLTQLTRLDLENNKLTDVKVLGKLMQLKHLYLDNNPGLTKVQIEQLQKALPNCKIHHNAKKSTGKIIKDEKNAKAGVKVKAGTEAKPRIADPIVEKPIRRDPKKSAGKTIKDEKLTKADLDKVTVLSLRHNRVTDVKGVEKLTQLKELDLHDNKLTDVTPLEKLGRLTYLNLQNNQLIELPKGLEKLTQLKELHLEDNPGLTKVQIEQLQKALPNCKIHHNAKKSTGKIIKDEKNAKAGVKVKAGTEAKPRIADPIVEKPIRRDPKKSAGKTIKDEKNAKAGVEVKAETEAEPLITDPIVEKQIRRKLKKSEGELTQADLEKVTEFSLFGVKITDTGLKEVVKLKNLTELELAYTRITDAGLKEVTKLTQLTNLGLSFTQTLDTGLKEVAKMKRLTHLQLNDTKITDAGLRELSQLKHLTELGLLHTKVTQAGIVELNKALSKCRIKHDFEERPRLLLTP